MTVSALPLIFPRTCFFVWSIHLSIGISISATSHPCQRRGLSSYLHTYPLSIPRRIKQLLIRDAICAAPQASQDKPRQRPHAGVSCVFDQFKPASTGPLHKHRLPLPGPAEAASLRHLKGCFWDLPGAPSAVLPAIPSNPAAIVRIRP